MRLKSPFHLPLCGLLLSVLLPCNSRVRAADPVPPATRPTGDLAARLLDLSAPTRTWEGADKFFVPPEDAPIDELLDFWTSPELLRLAAPAAIPEKLQRRLLDGCKDRPQALPALLSLLPQSPPVCATVKAIYDREAQNPAMAPAQPDLDAAGLGPEDWKKEVRHWLMMSGLYFRADLIAAAEQCRYENGDELANEPELRALATLDWRAAEPLVRLYASSPDAHVSTTALAMLYERAVSAGDAAAADDLRARLKSVAADAKDAPAFARDRAFEVLLANPWPDDTQWWLSLLGDSTLLDMSEGNRGFPWPLEKWSERQPDRTVPLLVKALGSTAPDVRDNAARLLSDLPRPDALRPLLPALMEPEKWPNGVANSVVRHLQALPMPESVPGLVRAWREGKLTHQTDAADLALALARQGAKEAAEALRASFPGSASLDAKGEFVGVMLACNALSEDEIESAIEASAVWFQEFDEAWKKGETGPRRAPAAPATRPGELSPSVLPDMGIFLSDKLRGRDDLAEKLLARVRSLRKDDPHRAAALWRELLAWPSPAVDREMVRRLRDEPLDEQAVEEAAGRSERLRQKAAREVGELAAAGGECGGLAAALLADDAVTRRVLVGRDRGAQRMLLAAARLAQTPLPLPAVADLMNGTDADLARSAEEYLVANDTPEAVRLVWARHPGEAVIVGGGERVPPLKPKVLDPALGTPRPPDPQAVSLEGLRAELLRPGGPDEIFVLIGGGGWGSPGDVVVRLRGNTARVESRSGGGKSASRSLTRDERKALLDLVASTKVDDLPPLHNSVLDGVWFTYGHLTRAGGRQVYMNNPGSAGTAGTPYDRVARFFRRLPEAGPLQPHYALEDAVPGSRVVFSDPKVHVAAVWTGGGDVRIRSWEGDANDRGAMYAATWHALRDGKVAGPAPEPPGYLPQVEDRLGASDVPKGFPIDLVASGPSWNAKAGDAVIRVGERWSRLGGGLWRCRKGKEPERITRGDHQYNDPVTTPDGKWAVVEDSEGGYLKPCPLVRVDLSSGVVRRLDLPADRWYSAVCWLPVHGRALVWGRLQANHSETSAFWLVDPASGKADPVQGEFEPLTQAYGRPLQPTEAAAKAGKADNADEVWAAVPERRSPVQTARTRVGRYDIRRFTFTPLLTLPGVEFNSSDMWVDEKGGQVYFAVNGDLLSVPLPASAPPPAAGR